jgi:hypothetical protein
MSTTIPRLQLDELRPDLAAHLAGTEVKRLGYLGELFQCAGHSPDALLAFLQLGDALGNALSDALVEVVALSVAGIMENAYERNRHERRCVELGFGSDWITAVNRLAPDKATPLSPQERAVQRYVLAAVIRRGTGATREFEAMRDHLAPAEAMAVILLAGWCVSHALCVNTLGLKPPVASIFEKRT